MKLKTYTRATEGPHVGQGPYLQWSFNRVDEWGDYGDGLRPGVWVRHKFIVNPKDRGFGLIIAISEDQLTILWSKEPRHPTISELEVEIKADLLAMHGINMFDELST